jgi:hypothetical protein
MAVQASARQVPTGQVAGADQLAHPACRAVHVWTIAPEQRVAPGVHPLQVAHAPFEQTWPEGQAAGGNHSEQPSSPIVHSSICAPMHWVVFGTQVFAQPVPPPVPVPEPVELDAAVELAPPVPVPEAVELEELDGPAELDAPAAPPDPAALPKVTPFEPQPTKGAASSESDTPKRHPRADPAPCVERICTFPDRMRPWRSGDCQTPRRCLTKRRHPPVRDDTLAGRRLDASETCQVLFKIGSAPYSPAAARLRRVGASRAGRVVACRS